MAQVNTDDLSTESAIDRTPAQLRQVRKLSPQERYTFGRLEVTITHGLKSFSGVGDALKTIRAQRLYREKYPNFQAYTKERWGFDAARARQLIGASDVFRDVETESPVKPVSEIQVRSLTRLDTTMRKRVWKEAVSRTEHPTEKTIKAVIRDIVPSDPDERQIAARDTAALINQLFVSMLSLMNEVREWHNIDEGLSAFQVRHILRGLQKIRPAMHDVEVALGRE